MKHPALFASDLHGNRFAYKRLFELAVERKIETVILGGDLTPKTAVLSFMGRCIVPTAQHLLTPDENGLTYAASLRRLRDMCKNRRTEMEKYFIWLGGFLVHTGVRLEWDALIDEQAVMAKALALDSDCFPPVRTANTPTFTDIEWDLLCSMIEKAGPQTPDFQMKLFQVRVMTLDAAGRSAFLGMYEKFARVQKEVKDLPRAAQQAFSLLPSVLVGLNQESGALAFFLGALKVAAGLHPLSLWIEKCRDVNLPTDAQATFLQQILWNSIKKYREQVPNGRVYLILGNDDMKECVPIIERMHQKGQITYIDRAPVDIGAVTLVGYPFVRNSQGRYYEAWERNEDQISQDLTELEKRCEGKPTVYVVHSPPHNTSLDWAHEGHVGSIGVREWLERGSKHLVLSGHIHEAPFINGGEWRTTIDGTPCIQPGGWHDEGLCAAVVDLENPSDAEWIHDPSKVRV